MRTLRLFSKTVRSALCVVTVAMMVNAPASADDPFGPVVGKKISEWTGLWWQWAFGQGFTAGPAFQAGSIDCAYGQKGVVWFLAGIGGNTDNPGGPLDADRTCSAPIPHGTRLLFPLINVSLASPDSLCPPGNNDPENPGVCTVEQKRTITDSVLSDLVPDVLNSTACRLRAELDRVPVNMSGTPIIRTQSPPFFVAALPGFVLEDDPNVISDGYWVMLPPLASGAHTLFISGGLCNEANPANIIFANDVTYSFTVK